jgi:hypothetical protein
MTDTSYDKNNSEYADALFERAWLRGQWRRWWARITGQDRGLPLLHDARARFRTIIALPPHRRAIRVDHIVGTDGALAFDCDFLPLDRRERDRWTSVAEAMLRDSLTLPPIQAVQVGDEYYIVDGHHRVSVARLLNRLYLEAEVTVWQTE